LLLSEGKRGYICIERIKSVWNNFLFWKRGTGCAGAATLGCWAGCRRALPDLLFTVMTESLPLPPESGVLRGARFLPSAAAAAAAAAAAMLDRVAGRRPRTAKGGRGRGGGGAAGARVAGAGAGVHAAGAAAGASLE